MPNYVQLIKKEALKAEPALDLIISEMTLFNARDAEWVSALVAQFEATEFFVIAQANVAIDEATRGESGPNLTLVNDETEAAAILKAAIEYVDALELNLEDIAASIVRDCAVYNGICVNVAILWYTQLESALAGTFKVVPQTINWQAGPLGYALGSPIPMLFMETGVITVSTFKGG